MKMNLVKTVQMACGQAYIVALDRDGKELLELGDVFLPKENAKGTRPFRFQDFGDVDDRSKRVITICSMVGCCYSCSFCASRRTFHRLLTADELLEQVSFCIEEGKRYGRSADPNESSEFHVLYTRMGEPSANIENVLASMHRLVQLYPHMKIGMSTQGIRGKTEEFLRDPALAPYLMMQFSIHGTEDETREHLLQTPIGSPLMSLEEIAHFVRKFRKLSTRPVSLNFILLEGIRYDFQQLRHLFEPKDVYIRLSPLNVTFNSDRMELCGLLQEEDVIHKSPRSSDELRSIIRDIESAGFTYAYAPAIDEEIKHHAACGQALEILRKDTIPR